MSPIQQLRQNRDSAAKAQRIYSDLYDALVSARDRVNLEDPACPLRWSQGELQLTEDGKAIVRWRFMNHTVILVAVVPNDPGRRVWGWGYHTREPYYDERMQESPPETWLDFVRTFYA